MVSSADAAAGPSGSGHAMNANSNMPHAARSSSSTSSPQEIPRGSARDLAGIADQGHIQPISSWVNTGLSSPSPLRCAVYLVMGPALAGWMSALLHGCSLRALVQLSLVPPCALAMSMEPCQDTLLELEHPAARAQNVPIVTVISYLRSALLSSAQPSIVFIRNATENWLASICSATHALLHPAGHHAAIRGIWGA